MVYNLYCGGFKDLSKRLDDEPSANISDSLTINALCGMICGAVFRNPHLRLNLPNMDKHKIHYGRM